MEKSDLNVANEIIFDLQDRIDEAIEYIENNNILLELLGDQKVKKELLDILKGSDKE